MGYRIMNIEFLEPEPTMTITEENLSDRIRYIQRSGFVCVVEFKQVSIILRAVHRETRLISQTKVVFKVIGE